MNSISFLPVHSFLRSAAPTTERALGTPALAQRVSTAAQVTLRKAVALLQTHRQFVAIVLVGVALFYVLNRYFNHSEETNSNSPSTNSPPPVGSTVERESPTPPIVGAVVEEDTLSNTAEQGSVRDESDVLEDPHATPEEEIPSSPSYRDLTEDTDKKKFWDTFVDSSIQKGKIGDFGTESEKLIAAVIAYSKEEGMTLFGEEGSEGALSSTEQTQAKEWIREALVAKGRITTPPLVEERSVAPSPPKIPTIAELKKTDSKAYRALSNDTERKNFWEGFVRRALADGKAGNFQQDADGAVKAVRQFAKDNEIRLLRTSMFVMSGKLNKKEREQALVWIRSALEKQTKPEPVEQ